MKFVFFVAAHASLIGASAAKSLSRATFWTFGRRGRLVHLARPFYSLVVRHPFRIEVERMLFGDEHVKRYRETDGAEGHEWREGSKILILTTTGRRSGEPRSMALIYGTHGDDYLVVASKGGSDQHPSWYLNLVENPEVTVQVLADEFPARARAATAEEKPELWRTMVGEWPAYQEYQDKTEREIPVVVLERA
jgi:deazaflavin-dependent oxidoreductase (nitroreductase family)